LDFLVESERCRVRQHRRWWNKAMHLGQQLANENGSELKKAAHVAASDSTAHASVLARSAKMQEKDLLNAERVKMVTQLEQTGALYRELSSRHQALHPILSYGSDGQCFTLVSSLSTSCGLRSVAFTQQRCHVVLGQALKALRHLHEHQVAHGHLSPESFLVEDSPLGPKMSLVWASAHRRPEGHALATLGFRGPGEWAAGPAADIWALACVVLVWWSNFNPAPHPWAQFLRTPSLQEDIHRALSEQPPALPKSLLDLHAAAAIAEEPDHTFLSLLASLLTKCLAWNAAERPSADQWLQDHFWEAGAL